MVNIINVYAELTRYLVQIKSVKILKDREDKPRGFGYVEFSTIDGLKDAIAKSGSVRRY